MKSYLRLWCSSLLALGLVLGATGCGSKEAEIPGSKTSIADALKGLKSEDPIARQDAATALAAKGPAAAEAVQPLIEALKDSDDVVRRLAAYALGQIGPKAAPAVPVLKGMMNDAGRELYTSILNALQQIDPKSVSEKIVNTSEPSK